MDKINVTPPSNNGIYKEQKKESETEINCHALPFHSLKMIQQDICICTY